MCVGAILKIFSIILNVCVKVSQIYSVGLEMYNHRFSKYFKET